jgi:hypothetical protein
MARPIKRLQAERTVIEELWRRSPGPYKWQAKGEAILETSQLSKPDR